jgi:hypothetical protein
MSRSVETMSPDDKQLVFDGLVSNGLRHLTRGLEGFETDHLDFAVTDAFFGFEIILKALVFQRDWQQIFTNPASADPVKLLSGECHTIGCADSIKRLKLLGLKLPRSVTHFKILERHRNKLVHYFHPDLATEHRRRRIASELANAWGALRTLRAISDISSALTPHEAEFGRLDGRLLVLDRYLDEQAVHRGADYAQPDRLVECPACKRETFDSDCILCGYSEPSHRELTQGAEAIGPADCPQCGGVESVVVSGTGARCTQSNCGAWFGGIHRCEFCQEFFVVENESELIDDEDHAGTGSYQFGCEKCDGNFGYQMSKDD